MSEFGELKDMLNGHIKDSNEFRDGMNKSMTELTIHSEYTKNTLTSNSSDISDLKASQNKQRGGMWVLGFLGAGGVIKVITDLFRHTAE